MTLPVPTQRTWTVGDLVTAALLNANVRDAVNYLLNPPSFFAYTATTQTITANSETAVVFGNVSRDNYAGMSASKNSYTIPPNQGGLWFFVGGIQLSAGTPSNLGIHLSGASGAMSCWNWAGVGANQSVTASIAVPLSAGNGVQCNIYTNTSATVASSTSTFFAGVRLSS